ncbi:HAD family hydrolase [Nocardia seriolae]|uniref:Haloacid dehalogenase n=1 Tax=Nocardia seriolae TaxID=37332 RepID=A0ABC9Z7F9_9NOCA|nr:HAD hydrolase family protein [Nocardia seriolae]PSK26809.1 haloacid dehalogenase [Nocardia seriolae]QOW33868.1 HAD hydrolase family protein [Nocardia seriolae]QUN18636.1 HAD hydrolase family protein [Nocardia seriolae]WNJ61068.1 HAD hydrolase family protein [Nocardia seriolae]GAM51072.1 haloacid dehalogenase [Nocardia seriolae]
MRHNAVRPLELHTFDPKPVVNTLISAFPGMVLSVEKVGVGLWSTAPESRAPSHGEFRIVDTDELSSEPTPRLNGFWPDGSIDAMVDILIEHPLPGAEWVRGEDGPWIVAFRQGVSKGWALERIRQRHNIPREATLAIGDGFNNLEMFSWAGYSVAMGNAVAPARARADEVTDEVANAGVALTLERWFDH